MADGPTDDRQPSARSALLSLDDGRIVEFGHSISFGRHALNDVVVAHPLVSGHHVVVEWDGQAWCVRDLGSRNVTLLNEQPLDESSPLHEGDVIQLAGVSQWRVERLEVPCDDVTLVRTCTAGNKFGMVGMQLFLGFVGPNRGVVRVVHPQGEWSVRMGRRFLLLHVLAAARGEWVSDEELGEHLFGPLGLSGQHPSTLHRLTDAVKAVFREQEIDAWFVQRRLGRSRLALPEEQVHLVDGGEIDDDSPD